MLKRHLRGYLFLASVLGAPSVAVGQDRPAGAPVAARPDAALQIADAAPPAAGPGIERRPDEGILWLDLSDPRGANDLGKALDDARKAAEQIKTLARETYTRTWEALRSGQADWPQLTKDLKDLKDLQAASAGPAEPGLDVATLVETARIVQAAVEYRDQGNWAAADAERRKLQQDLQDAWTMREGIMCPGALDAMRRHQAAVGTQDATVDQYRERYRVLDAENFAFCRAADIDFDRFLREDLGESFTALQNRLTEQFQKGDCESAIALIEAWSELPFGVAERNIMQRRHALLVALKNGDRASLKLYKDDDPGAFANEHETILAILVQREREQSRDLLDGYKASPWGKACPAVGGSAPAEQVRALCDLVAKVPDTPPRDLAAAESRLAILDRLRDQGVRVDERQPRESAWRDYYRYLGEAAGQGQFAEQLNDVRKAIAALEPLGIEVPAGTRDTEHRLATELQLVSVLDGQDPAVDAVSLRRLLAMVPSERRPGYKAALDLIGRFQSCGDSTEPAAGDPCLTFIKSEKWADKPYGRLVQQLREQALAKVRQRVQDLDARLWEQLRGGRPNWTGFAERLRVLRGYGETAAPGLQRLDTTAQTIQAATAARDRGDLQGADRERRKLPAELQDAWAMRATIMCPAALQRIKGMKPADPKGRPSPGDDGAGDGALTKEELDYCQAQDPEFRRLVPPNESKPKNGRSDPDSETGIAALERRVGDDYSYFQIALATWRDPGHAAAPAGDVVAGALVAAVKRFRQVNFRIKKEWGPASAELYDAVREMKVIADPGAGSRGVTEADKAEFVYLYLWIQAKRESGWFDDAISQINGHPSPVTEDMRALLAATADGLKADRHSNAGCGRTGECARRPRSGLTTR